MKQVQGKRNLEIRTAGKTERITFKSTYRIFCFKSL